MKQTIISAAVAAVIAACCSFVVADARQPAHAKPDPNRFVVAELKKLNSEMASQGADPEQIRDGIGTSYIDSGSIRNYVREIEENTR